MGDRACIRPLDIKALMGCVAANGNFEQEIQNACWNPQINGYQLVSEFNDKQSEANDAQLSTVPPELSARSL